MRPEQMDRELQGDAPRVIKLKNELQWSLWTKKQLEDQQLNTYERQVADGYWRKVGSFTKAFCQNTNPPIMR